MPRGPRTRRLGERPAASSAALDEGLERLRATDLREETSALAIPALVIHGARDRIVPVEAGRWLARTLPGARLVEFPDCAHLPFVSNRDAVRDALEAFDA
jgi:pimeloyl-[acyl-carrier protein] methyl ester esterase